MWRPTPSEELERELSVALARPCASWVKPPRPVACSDGRTGWLWGRMRTDAGAWLGLATLQRSAFDVPDLGWHPAGDLRTLDD